MATIKEIAVLAGVSRGTVDRVLNNRGGVHPDTEEKIKEIIKALDYKPNPAGLVLAAQKRTIKLGVILFSSDNPFFALVEEGVKEKSEELSSYNCTVLMKHIHFNVDEQLEAIDQLLSYGINGLAIAPYNHEKIRKKINLLYTEGIPVVTLNTDIENSKRIAYVGSNYTKSGETAAGLMLLMAQKPMQIGIITGSSNILCHTERISGFIKTLEKHSSSFKILDIVENRDDEFESYEQTNILLKKYPQINALYFVAGGVYGGCRSVLGFHSPQLPTIISYDMVPTTKELVANGTIAATICQQPKVQGSKPLSLLFTYLTTGELPEKEYHYVAVDIRIRENI